MGLVIDTNVFFHAEKSSGPLDFNRWIGFGQAYISSVSVFEWLVGVHRANSEQQRRGREAFVEAVIAGFPALEFTTDVARTHARLIGAIGAGQMVGAQDAMIGATAGHYGFAVLTENIADFGRIPGLQVVSLFS